MNRITERILKLPSVALEEKDSLPSVRCIYFVLSKIPGDNDSKVSYIGISEDLHCRWKSHHKLNELELLALHGIELRIYWIKSQNPRTVLMAWETYFIKELQPCLNGRCFIKTAQQQPIKQSEQSPEKSFPDMSYMLYQKAFEVYQMKGKTFTVHRILGCQGRNYNYGKAWLEALLRKWQ